MNKKRVFSIDHSGDVFEFDSKCFEDAYKKSGISPEKTIIGLCLFLTNLKLLDGSVTDKANSDQLLKLKRLFERYLNGEFERSTSEEFDFLYPMFSTEYNEFVNKIRSSAYFSYMADSHYTYFAHSISSIYDAFVSADWVYG